MKIVTGYRGIPHITSNAAQAFNQGVIGSNNFVLNVGSKFAATLSDVNTVTIADGEGVIQGAHFRIEGAETVNIANGSTGFNRIDLICARYTKNGTTGIEDVSLVVIQGEETASTATAPDYNTGDILDGESPIDFPLYKVSLNGLTPSVSKMFIVANPIPRIERGTTPGGSVASGAYFDEVITFANPFNATPTVVVGFTTNADQGNFGRCCCAAVLSSLSKTGFTIRTYNGDSQSRSPRCSWIAIGV